MGGARPLRRRLLRPRRRRRASGGRTIPRGVATLRRAAEEIDVLVGSGADAVERFDPGELEPAPGITVTTAGALGGWVRPGGPFRAVPPPGPVQDAYGCGDCFAAGLTFGLAGGRTLEESLLLGSRCGAAVLTGRGPYAGQLTAATLDAAG
jgi:ribokinase